MSTLEELSLTLTTATLQQHMNAVSNMNTNINEQPAEETAPLHCIGTRPHYDWTPSPFLTELLQLDSPLHTSPPLSESDRKAIIETYPPISSLDYKAPATVPTAEKLMNKGQELEDRSLKHLQYMLSAPFRPLDALAHELVSTERENSNLERYLTMLNDVYSSFTSERL